jgi:hypothetical protein
MANGDVVFAPQPVGTEVSFALPIHETASGTSETLVSAMLQGTGKDSFAILSAFPIAIAADRQVTVDLEFVPQHSGDVSAQLVLQTEKMGMSTIQLSGSSP